MNYKQFSSVTNLGNQGYFGLAFTETPVADSTRFEAVSLFRYVFLTSYSEDFSATWDVPERAFGRLNPDYRYGQTNRRVSMGFKLPARSVAEAKENLKFCEDLARLTYGKYSTSGATNVFNDSRYRYEGANLNIRVDFGSLLQDEACFINDFNMDINIDAGVFEYDGQSINTPGGNVPNGSFQDNEFEQGRLSETSYVNHSQKGKVYPKEINVTINMIILHDYRLGFGGPDRPGKPNYWAQNKNKDWPHGAGPTSAGDFPRYMSSDADLEPGQRVQQPAEYSGLGTQLPPGVELATDINADNTGKAVIWPDGAVTILDG